MRFNTPAAIRLAAALLVLLAPALVSAQFLLDPLPVWTSVDSIESNPAVAFNGTNYLAVWQLLNRRHEDIRAGRITPGGQVLDPQGIEVTNDTFEQYAPAIAAGNGLSLVVWQDWRRVWTSDIRAARIDTTGSVLDPAGFVVAGGYGIPGRPAVAFGHGKWLVTWDEIGIGRDVKATMVDTAGSVGPAIAVSRHDWHESLPSVAATASGFVVAWEDRRHGSYPQAYCARLDPTGAVLDSTGLPLWTDRYSQNRPLTAAIGDTALVAWEEEAVVDSDVWGMRIDAAGVLLDTAPIRIVTGPGRPDGFCLAARDSDYVVLWPVDRDSTDGSDLWVVRVGTDGTVHGPLSASFLRLPGEQDQAAVAFGDSQTLVAWRDDEGDSTEPDIKATRVDAFDSILDPTGLRVTALGDLRYFEQYNPTAASDGSNYLVAWTDMRHRSTKPDIYGNLVHQSGVPRDSAALPLCEAPGAQDSVRLAYCRGRYLAVWLDRRSGQKEVYAARFDSAGRKIDTADIRIAGGHVQGLAVCAGDSNWLIAWCGLGHSQVLDVKATVVDLSGAVSHPDGASITFTSTSEFWPAVAYDGRRFYVCWHVFQDVALNYEIAGVLLSDSLVPSSARLISRLPGSDDYVSLAGSQEGVLAGWLNRYPSNYTNVRVTRLDTTGIPIDSPPVLLASANRSFGTPMSAVVGSHYYVLWQWKIDNVRWRYWGARISTGGVVMDSFALVAPSESALWSAGVTAGNDQALLVYASVVDSLRGIPVGTRRTNGLLSPFGGVAEIPQGTGAQPTAAPNPFRSTVRLALPRSSAKYVEIFNSAGCHVRSVARSASGIAVWNGEDRRGKAIAPGVYFISVGDGAVPLRVVRLR